MINEAFIYPILYISFYLVIIYIICRIFNIEFFKSLTKGVSLEFKKSSGRICFAAFIIALLFGLEVHAKDFVENILMFFAGYPNNTQAENFDLSLRFVLILAFSWLAFNFIVLSIFESKNNDPN